MGQKVIAALLVTAVLAGAAVAEDTLWTRRYSNGTIDRGRAGAAVGADIYVVSHSDIGGEDMTAVLKYRSGGDTAWVRPLNLAAAEQPFGAGALPDSGVVVAATVPGPSPSVRIARLTKAGDTVWTRTADRMMGTGLATDNAGNTFLWGSAPGATPVESLRLTKYDLSGAVGLNRTWRFGSVNQGAGCCVDNSGNVIAGANVIETEPRAAVVKFTPGGDTAWLRYPTELTGSQSVAVAADAAGNVYVAASAGAAGRLLKAGPDGSVEWTRPVNGQVSPDGYGAVTPNRDSCMVVAVSGENQYCGLIKFSPSGIDIARNEVAVPAMPARVVVGTDNRPVVISQTIASPPECLTVKFTGLTAIAEPGAGRPAPGNRATLTGRNRSLAVAIPRSGRHAVRLLDCTGAPVATLYAGYLAAGGYQFELPNLAAGVYYLSLGDPETAPAKVVVAR